MLLSRRENNSASSNNYAYKKGFINFILHTEKGNTIDISDVPGFPSGRTLTLTVDEHLPLLRVIDNEDGVDEREDGFLLAILPGGGIGLTEIDSSIVAILPGGGIRLTNVGAEIGANAFWPIGSDGRLPQDYWDYEYFVQLWNELDMVVMEWVRDNGFFETPDPIAKMNQFLTSVGVKSVSFQKKTEAGRIMQWFE